MSTKGIWRKRIGLVGRMPTGAVGIALAGLTVLALAERAATQGTGAIIGRIAEEGGATVAGAQVGLDGGQRSTLTNELGAFRLKDVSPGRHAIAVEHIGFATHEGEIVVTP